MKKSTKKKPSLKKLPKFKYAGTYSSADPNRSVDAFTGQVNYGNYAKGVGAGVSTAEAELAIANPGESDFSKGITKQRAVESGIAVGVGTYFSPIVGAAAGALYSAGAKQRRKDEEIDPNTGKLVNRNAAIHTAMLQGFSNPITMLTTRSKYSGGFTDFSGNGYADKLEEDSVAKANERKIQEDKYKQQQSTQQYPQMVARNGGQMPRLMKYEFGGNSENPNAELEKQEVVQTPQGQIDNVNGPSHENGGVEVNIPEQSRILSDKLKMPGTKKTFAKLGKPLNTSKEEKIIDNPDAQGLSKSTASLMLQAKNNKLNELFQIQEQLKKSKVAEYAKKMGVDINSLTRPQQDEQEQVHNPQEEMQEHRYGGKQLPKYPYGKDGVWYDNPRNYHGIGDENKTFGNKGPTLNPDGSVNYNFKTSPQYNQNDFYNSGRKVFNGTGYTANNAYNEGINEPNDTSSSMIQNSRNDSNSMYNFWDKNPNVDRKQLDYNMIGDTVAGISNLAGPIYGLATNKKLPDVHSQLINPKYLDNSEALKNERENYLMNKNDIKEIGQGNTSQIMSNYIRNKSKSTQDRAQIQENFNNANAAIYNRADEGNVNIKISDAEKTAMDQANTRNLNTKYVGDIGTGISNINRDRKSEQYDQEFLDFLDREYPGARQKFYKNKAKK